MVNKVDVLVRLFETIEKRSKEDPSKSYTAKLLSEGKAKCIEKLKEESLETVEGAEQGLSLIHISEPTRHFHI